jgi:murein DD-endopeptidase MepM/ murein hydrolase activator NlpD
VAVVSGQIARHHSGAGGLAIYLYGDDGATYYYAHLSEVVGPDRRVAQGEVVARTGNSGNARGGAPHTHFEIHPGGAEAVNPYPSVRAVC